MEGETPVLAPAAIAACLPLFGLSPVQRAASAVAVARTGQQDSPSLPTLLGQHWQPKVNGGGAGE